MLAGKLNDLDILRQKVVSLQDHESLERSLTQYCEEMKDLEIKRKEYQDVAYSTKQAVLKEFTDFIVFCTDLKDFQDKALRELQEYIEYQDPFVIVLSPSDEELLEQK